MGHLLVCVGGSQSQKNLPQRGVSKSGWNPTIRKKCLAFPHLPLGPSTLRAHTAARRISPRDPSAFPATRSGRDPLPARHQSISRRPASMPPTAAELILPAAPEAAPPSCSTPAWRPAPLPLPPNDRARRLAPLPLAPDGLRPSRPAAWAPPFRQPTPLPPGVRAQWPSPYHCGSLLPFLDPFLQRWASSVQCRRNCSCNLWCP
jgi:hypothetical protein